MVPLSVELDGSQISVEAYGPPQVSNSLRSTEICSGESMLVSGGSDRRVKLWKMPDGRLLRSLIGHGNDPALAITPDGGTLAVGEDRGGVISLWSLPEWPSWCW